VLFGPAIAAAIIGRMAWSAVFVAVGERRKRLSHAEAVRLVGRYDAKLGITVLDSDVPAVYCLPGRPATIVVTSSARALLRPRQLAAALAHEHAHLRGNHHLALIAARVFTRAFGVVPLFRTAEQEIALLLEVAADDAAARGHGRRTLARALLTLAGGRSMIPSVGMPAGGSGVVSRVDRLLNPPRSSGIAGFLRGVAPLAVNVTASFVLTGLPAAALAFHFGACSPHFS
jgi:Zn-dependent protease with chaperone function